MKTVLIIEGSLGSCLLERKDSVLRHRLNKSLFSKMKQILQRETGVVCLQVKHHNEFHVENFKESLINMCEAGYKFVGKGSPPPYLHIILELSKEIFPKTRPSFHYPVGNLCNS